jgi:DNA-binding phage protein
MADQQRQPHVCSCASCRDSPGSDTAEDHRAINRVVASLDERRRRLFAGLLAQQRGHGGVALVARTTGLSRTTIHRGMLELQRPGADPGDRIRRPGGGRPRAEKKPRAC